jgi:hypothetical protein
VIPEKWQTIACISLVLYEHHFATRHQPVIDVDIDGLADLAVQFEHRARPELEEAADVHMRATEHSRDLHRHVEHRLEVRGATIDRFRVRRGERACVRYHLHVATVLEVGQWHLSVVVTHCCGL